ncbi:MAG TPA: flagellar biosynthesis regulator FlaF [Rhodospirillales bacterium]|nr:flagellar biosynthesis regulator FlaF [Rhodospirillales bacterium]
MADHPLLGEDEARALSRAASLIEAVKVAGANDPEAVARALDHNLAVWRSIGEAVVRANGALSPAVRANLDKLGAAVAAATTTADGAGKPEKASLSALININRCISARLREGQAAAQS